jgi:hypothetical protein
MGLIETRQTTLVQLLKANIVIYIELRLTDVVRVYLIFLQPLSHTVLILS